MLTSVSVKTIAALATGGLLAQIAPAQTGMDAAGRLTLDAALIIAVGVLWRALAKKDDQVFEMAKKVTETMSSVLTAVQELRAAVNDIGEEQDEHPARRHAD